MKYRLIVLVVIVSILQGTSAYAADSFFTRLKNRLVRPKPSPTRTVKPSALPATRPSSTPKVNIKPLPEAAKKKLTLPKLVPARSKASNEQKKTKPINTPAIKLEDINKNRGFYTSLPQPPAKQVTSQSAVKRLWGSLIKSLKGQ